MRNHLDYECARLGRRKRLYTRVTGRSRSYNAGTPSDQRLSMRDFDELSTALNRSRFRSRFRLDAELRDYLRQKGLPTVLEHARRFVVERLAPAQPHNEGRQTPMRGHPVFVAQHATGTCCRSCLAKWHRIAEGRPLNEQQIQYVVAVLGRWLEKQGGTDDPSYG